MTNADHLAPHPISRTLCYCSAAMDRVPSHVLSFPPLAPHRLIGREREQEAARAYLLDKAVPLLTLSGPGGVGKTRLALAIAGAIADRFHDGVVWVDLAPVRDPALVPAIVASACGVTLAAGQSDELELARRLRSRQSLVLCDNCEHLAVAVAGLVARLLEYCPAVQVLATSRAPLGLRGEQVLPVGPLILPTADEAAPATLEQIDAVCLFVERVRERRPDFALTTKNAPAVVSLCRHLDGLPLAIELAAARSTTHTPEELLAQMVDRMRLLSAGPRDMPARQQTIRDAIAWSYDLLDTETQALFRGLSVFLGGFTAEAAEVVTEREGGKGGRGEWIETEAVPTRSALDSSVLLFPGPRFPPSPSVLERLTTLVDQSLVQRMEAPGESRFTMLETIRAFGLERLEEAGEREAAQDALAAHVIALAERWDRDFAEAPEWEDANFQRVEIEQANIRAALTRLADVDDAERVLRLASMLSGSWERSLNPREGRQWLEWALANTPETPTAGRCHALGSLSEMLWVQCRYEQAHRCAEASLAIARQLDIQQGTAYAIHMLGNVALSQHDWERAKPLLEEAIDRWRALGVGGQVMEGYALQMLAGVEHGLGNEEGCARYATEALSHFRAIGNETGAASALGRLGRMTRDQGFDHTAALTFREELRISIEVGGRLARAQAFAGLGEIASRHGLAEIAAVLIGAIDAIAQEGGATRVPAAGVNYDRATSASRLALGDDRFAELRAAGRKLPLERAITLAWNVAIPTARTDEPPVPWLSPDAVARASPEPAVLLPASKAPAAVVELATLLPADVAPDLTYRERDVLALLCQRQTDGEIAARLFIGQRTVSTHVSNILAKLGAANRREAAAIAARQGLLQS